MTVFFFQWYEDVASIVSEVTFIFVPVYISGFSHWFLLRFSCYYWFEQFDFDGPLCSFLCVFYVGDFLSFFDFWMYGFHQIWKIFGHYLFRYLLSPPTPSFRDTVYPHFRLLEVLLLHFSIFSFSFFCYVLMFSSLLFAMYILFLVTSIVFLS